MVRLILLPIILLTIAQSAWAAQKVTQAALLSFGKHEVVALAIEEFGKFPKLLMKEDSKEVFSTEFADWGPIFDEFAYANSFLRFRSFQINGLPKPLVVAIAVHPGGSDVSYEIKLIAERNGNISVINSKPIMLSIQDGIYLGYINKKYGFGMITWHFQWDAAHYDPHKYEVTIYSWDKVKAEFTERRKILTNRKFADGRHALKHLGLPSRNYRNEVIKVEEDISTLGIEDEVLKP